MQWDYLYDESEKTLAPFFSESIMLYNFRCLIITCLVLLAMWPRLPFYHFLEISHPPLLFFQVFSAVTILCSYLSLRCGRGEMVLSDHFSVYYKEEPCFEKERNFFTYGLMGFLLHTVFLVLPYVPILIIATTVSWIPFVFFGQAIIVLYSSALLCRMMGFVFYLIGGKMSYSGYFIARVFIIIYLFATTLFDGRINPLNFFFRLNKYTKATGSPFDSMFGYYAAVTGIALCILMFICHVLIARHNHRMK